VTAAAEPPDTTAPFGLPVLAELPELAAVLERLDTAERAMLDAVVGLARLLATDEVATTSGVPVETWIASVTRHTRLDRRLLLRTARWLTTRLPTPATAATQRRVSWPQLHRLTLTLAELPPATTTTPNGGWPPTCPTSSPAPTPTRCSGCLNHRPTWRPPPRTATPSDDPTIGTDRP
jgi:hypothetical protein